MKLVAHLPNGMPVLCAPMPHLETMAIGVWVRTGARFEAVETHGVSHFLEHMAFKGTKRRSAAGLAEEIENAGGAMNAATGHETTGYWMRLLAHDLPLGIDILGDILTNPAFEAREIERERGVILDEISATLDTPDDRVFDLLLDAAYPEQALGRTILGTRESIRALTRDDLARHTGTHYRARAMAVAVAGKIAPDEVMRLVEAAFGAYASGDTPPPTPATFTPGERRLVKPLEQAHIAVAFEGVASGAADEITAQVFAHILGGGMASRLFQELREKHGLCYAVSAFHTSFADTGLVGFYAACAPHDLAELLRRAADTMMRLLSDIKDEEIARAQAQMKSGLLMGLERPLARADMMAQNYFTYGRILSPEDWIARIEAVDADAVSHFAKTHIAQTFNGAGALALAAVGPVEGLEPYDTLARRFA